MARAGVTVERVVRAGAELADEIGFDRVTVAAVARALGVQTASLYSHIDGTADLSTRITLLALEELADRASDAVAGLARRDAVAGLMNAYRDYAREHPGRFAATLATVDAATAASSAGPRHARLAEAVLRGYGLPADATVHAVRLIGSTTRGFITLEASGSFGHSAPPPEESWQHIIGALHTLLTQWPAASQTTPGGS
jgi:AcrR family transcriptional regulator